MKKTALALAIILALLFLTLTGAPAVRLGKGNPWYEERWTDPPVISTFSPANGTSSEKAFLNFTVTKPEKWKDTPTVYLSTPTRYGEVQQFDYVKIEIDGKLLTQIDVHSDLSSPFSYSEGLTSLTDGTHRLQIFAFGIGVVEGCEWKPNTSVDINSSSILYFTVVGQSSSPTPTMPNMGPTQPPPYFDLPPEFAYLIIMLLVVIASVVIIGLLVYFKKSQRNKIS
jgi:hypothetical protein